MCRFVEPEEMLRPCTRSRETDAERHRVGGDEVEALEKSDVCIGEVPARGQGACAGEEKLDSLGRRGIPPEQAQRDLEPAGGALRRPMDGRVAGLPQSRDSVRVPLPAGPLDVMCSLCGSRSASRQGVCTSFVGAQTPTSWRSLVDRPPDEWVSEAEPSRNVGLQDDSEAHQLVDRLERRRLDDARGRGCEFRLEGISDDRGSLEHEMRAVGQQGQLLGQCRGDGRRHAEVRGDSRHRGVAFGSTVQGPEQLFQVERVAAALGVQGGRDRVLGGGSQELVRLGPGECAERDADQGLRLVRTLELGSEPRRHLLGADRERDQDRRVRWPAKQAPEELDGGRVRPVQVVEHQHQRPGGRQALQQLAYRAVRAVALVLVGCRTVSGRG